MIGLISKSVRLWWWRLTGLASPCDNTEFSEKLRDYYADAIRRETTCAGVDQIILIAHSDERLKREHRPFVAESAQMRIAYLRNEIPV